MNPRKGNSQPEIRCKQSDIDLTISNYNNVSPHQECRPPIRIGINGLSAVPFTIYLFHSEQQERRFKTITRLYGVLKLPEYRFETRHLSEANSTNQYTPTKPSKLSFQAILPIKATEPAKQTSLSYRNRSFIRCLVSSNRTRPCLFSSHKLGHNMRKHILSCLFVRKGGVRVLAIYYI